MTRPYKGKRPRTLLDGLSEISENEIIAVGSDTAFIFIGTKADFLKDLPMWEFYYANVKKQSSWYGRQYSEEKVPFLNRTITEMFIKCTPGEPECLTFIVKGKEEGKVWLMSEYDEARKRTEKAVDKYKKGKENEKVQADIV